MLGATILIMKKRVKNILIIVPIVIIVLLIISGFSIIYNTKTQIRELFQMNKQLQEEGYYMAEFEFKLLGLGYLIDKGHRGLCWLVILEKF